MRLSTLISAFALSAIPALASVVETESLEDESASVPSELYSHAGNATHYGGLNTDFVPDWDIRDLANDVEVEDRDTHELSARAASCFPAIGFTPPQGRAPSIPAYKWWCDRRTEYAFMGFSYDVNSCPSKALMARSFKQMRQQYKARYVRIYGACTSNHAFYDQIVAAAYEAGVGVYGLIWFGFNGPSDKNWEGQLNGLIKTIKTNRYAPYVIRSVAIGSEPLYDGAIQANELVNKIVATRKQISALGVHVSTSEMAYKLAQYVNVLGVTDSVQLNLLPFFSSSASIGNSTSAHQQVIKELDQMKAATRGTKKLLVTQTGWPSNTAVWKPNSRSARADIFNEQKYYDMLDGFCWTFKRYPAGGVGWFAHIWEDNDLPGWGIVKNGIAKIVFRPKTQC
ncbi:glycoside hydrolase [Auriculariales sp. MPI-PUGE-AT-0066]|nr:glycoside hydrolase [Auriculariales sp. MPI-PUGE-AT-0066]